MTIRLPLRRGKHARTRPLAALLVLICTGGVGLGIALALLAGLLL